MALRKTQKQVLVWAQHTLRAGNVYGFVSDYPEDRGCGDYVIWTRARATQTIKLGRQDKRAGGNGDVYGLRAAKNVIEFTN